MDVIVGRILQHADLLEDHRFLFEDLLIVESGIVEDIGQ